MGDIIKLISHVGLPQSNCPLDSSLVSVNSGIISVYTFHSSGWQTTPCTAIDTLTIGVLNEGTYELHYHAGRTSSLAIHDIDTIVFEVQGVTGLQSFKNPAHEIKIYPNPSSGSFLVEFETKFTNSTVEVYDVLGKKVFSSLINEIGNVKAKIDISGFPVGIYRVNIFDGQNNISGKIIKSNS